MTCGTLENEMSTDPSFALFAVSALDGRYASAVAPLAPFFSEWALIKYRVVVEVEWLRTLSREAAIPRSAVFGM